MSSNIVAESWTWYALVWFVVVCRIISQILLRGSIKKLRPDDGLILFAMMTYTVLIVSINIVSDTASNLIDPEDHVVLTPESLRERRFGSKMVLIVEQMQISTVWIVKTCLLIMYYRLTLGLAQNTAVKLVAVYIAIGWIVMEILYFGVWCRPFSGYWEVPPSNPQCATALHHLITNAVFNISSDIMIILIPIPLLLRTHWPLKKKLILCVVFGLGGFTILSAVLNKYYSFTQPYGSQWTFWYIRESSTAIIVANLPLTWTLIRRVFSVGSFRGGSGRRSSAAIRSTQTENERKHAAYNPHSTIREPSSSNQSQEVDGTL
ncbi:hypothetical protein H634G_04875 [Metarhizium anisopliae BRIP 53293]|uniref:Rhodopsin domain-containing protein n=1 Tax=Metarhizium anisopliae BRIP 53293 TaxID=1291518 RepID=A0A0D9P751_METAN|nr:hypothetical protein H634G_04875 [Metarhizium anisopliae BRIP 53293]KJK87816.1 hypothetical protein H633G_08319 [Metarhizium anisopliae BRIP 53284]